LKRIVLLLILSSFILVGCGSVTEKDITNSLNKKINGLKGYYLEGELEILNNEDTYKYDVVVFYKKEDMFKVSLTNKLNNHEQIILKNKEGVYVLTPSLNKSFKFQSEWPYNNSQSYLLQSLIKDMKVSDGRSMEEKDGHYLIKSKVNYPNNKNLTNQIVYLDKDKNFKEVHVLNDKNEVQIKMKFTNIDMKKVPGEKDFKLEENMRVSAEYEEVFPVTKIEDIIYPMYIPLNTKLTSQDKVTKSDGERIILTFAGDSPFMLVEETVSKDESVIPMYGEPGFLMDTIGAISDNSITWSSNGIEFYLVSDVLDKDELLLIAKSVSSMPVAK